MTNKELYKITSEFSDVKDVLQKKKQHNQKGAQLRRKLNTLYKRYSFLQDMVSKGGTGNKIVSAVELYFKHLKIETHNVEKRQEEDLQLWYNDKLILVEITGIKDTMPAEDKTHQISKHINIKQEKNPLLKVSGAFIINHFNERNFTKRNASVFSPRAKEIARTNKYTLHTTIELLNYFIEIKKGTSSLDGLMRKLYFYE